LIDDEGSYLQVGRSGFCCCLEWHDTKSQRHCRAFQQPPVVPWPGVTRIYVIGGELSLRQEEYFSPTQATEALLAFLHQQPFPNFIQWRDIASELNAKGCTLFSDAEAPREYQTACTGRGDERRFRFWCRASEAERSASGNE
jgi:hypothetical protein